MGLGMHPTILHPRRSQIAPKVMRGAPDSGTAAPIAVPILPPGALAGRGSWRPLGTVEVLSGRGRFCTGFLDPARHPPDNADRFFSR
jgi:hypothetical protein